MGLLELQDDIRAYPTPECREIEAFRVLIERDDSEHCTSAVRELSYVYHMTDPTSPYADMEEDVRHNELVKSLFENKDWEPDAAIEEAMERYEEINMSASMKMLKSALVSVHNLREYFEEVDLTKTDERGKPIWKAKDVVKNLSRIGDVIEGLKNLRREVEKEQVSQGDNRANVKTNKYSH